MTRVGGRPEVVVEGSDSLEGDWKEYEFLYKPGNLSRTPPVVGKYKTKNHSLKTSGKIQYLFRDTVKPVY